MWTAPFTPCSMRTRSPAAATAACCGGCLADGYGDRADGTAGDVFPLRPAGGSAGAALRPAAGAAEPGRPGLGRRAGQCLLCAVGVPAVLFCYGGRRRAAALFPGGRAGRRGAVFLPAQPNPAASVGLLAADPALAGPSGGGRGKKMLPRDQKTLSSRAECGYNRMGTLEKKTKAVRGERR